MFEREIQFIYDFSHNKIKKLGSFITFNELKSTNLHPAILQYISAEIDFYIFEDRQKLLKDSLFDYSGNKINSYFLQISEEIKKSKKFSQSYIEKLILHSVTFTVNHLVSPNSLISQFIFEEDKEKSTSEIKQILNYLYYYPHINKIISSYLDKKNLMKITSEEFAELLKKIDKIGLEANSEKFYNEALESMSEFFNVGMSGRALIPVLAVQSYLKDKELNIYHDKLKSEFVDAELTRYEIKDYQKILVGLDTDRSKPAKEAETEEVFESDIVDHTLHSHSFQAVEEELKNEKKDFSVDIRIVEDESRKVILDEQPIAEVESESEEQIETVAEEITDGTESEETEASEDIIDEEQISETTDPEEDLIATPEDEEILDDSTVNSSEIFEIEDERELENETVAEVMELAKEELGITSDIDSSDEEIYENKVIVDEDTDDLIEELEKKSDTIESDFDAAKKLYLKETGYKKDDESPGNEELNEVLSVSDDNQSIEEFVDAEEKENISFIDDDEEESVEFEEETISVDKEKITEVDDENNMDKIVSSMSDRFSKELEDENLSEPLAEAKDTLSNLLNEDSVDIESDEELVEDELIEADEEQAEIEDIVLTEEEEEEPEIEKAADSDEDLKLFNEGKEEENEISLEANKEEEVKEETSESMGRPIDITSLLENRKMSKIIDVIFDYDMEEFANAIEEISEAPNIDIAISIIDKVCNASQISESSKEAKLFKSIISDHYDRK